MVKLKPKPYPSSKVKRRPADTSIADSIKLRVAQYFKRKRRAVFFEMGLLRGGKLRADVLVLAMNGHTVVVEVKSSVADFRTDKKMHLYLDYCNQFYLAIPKSVYDKVKDSYAIEGGGVFIMSEDGKHITEVRRARNYDIEPSVATNLAIRAAFRNSDFNTRKNVRV